jgi:hypothetical protein
MRYPPFGAARLASMLIRSGAGQVALRAEVNRISSVTARNETWRCAQNIQFPICPRRLKRWPGLAKDAPHPAPGCRRGWMRNCSAGKHT